MATGRFGWSRKPVKPLRVRAPVEDLVAAIGRVAMQKGIASMSGSQISEAEKKQIALLARQKLISPNRLQNALFEIPSVEGILSWLKKQ